MAADRLAFNEIHKMKNWKKFLKGIYDTRRRGGETLLENTCVQKSVDFR